MPLVKNTETEYINIEGDKQIAVLYINRPKAYNALSTELAQEILDFFRSLKDLANLSSVVLASKCKKAFCAGADLKERSTFDKAAWQTHHKVLEDIVAEMRKFELPIIAAVNGFAFGGGFELVLLSDLIIASPDALFALPEAKIGIIPGMGGTQIFVRKVPFNFAKETLLTGRSFSAKRAYDLGFVNEIIDTEDLAELASRAIELAKEISDSAKCSIIAAKECLNKGVEMSLDQALDFELGKYNELLDRTECYEGVKAFAEKRKPQFN